MKRFWDEHIVALNNVNPLDLLRMDVIIMWEKNLWTMVSFLEHEKQPYVQAQMGNNLWRIQDLWLYMNCNIHSRSLIIFNLCAHSWFHARFTQHPQTNWIQHWNNYLILMAQGGVACSLWAWGSLSRTNHNGTNSWMVICGVWSSFYFV
jgi:hypothetical protein